MHLSHHVASTALLAGSAIRKRLLPITDSMLFLKYIFLFTLYGQRKTTWLAKSRHGVLRKHWIEADEATR